jgi:hypothetical protein
MRCRAAQLGAIMLALALAGCYRPPTENELVHVFESHRPDFDRLRSMAVADRKFYRISGGEIPPHGMSQARYKEYLMIFRELEVDGGMNWGYPSSPDGLFVIASSCVPIGGKNQSVGYAYLEIRPTALETRLSISGCPIQMHRTNGQHLVFRPLQDRWYLFYYLAW